MNKQAHRPGGVLPLIPAAILAATIKGLPRAGRGQHPVTVEIEVPSRGRAAVEFAAEWVGGERYRWVAKHADPVGPFVLPPDPLGGCFTCHHFQGFDWVYISAICGRVRARKLWRQPLPYLGCYQHDRVVGADDDPERIMWQYGYRPPAPRGRP